MARSQIEGERDVGVTAEDVEQGVYSRLGRLYVWVCDVNTKHDERYEWYAESVVAELCAEGTRCA